MISRRRIVLALGSAALSIPLARAQQQSKIRRIGVLTLAPDAPVNEALRQGLRELGWIEGQNIIFEYRGAEKGRSLPEAAAELVGLKVDVIFAGSSTYVEPAKQATNTIPIVFAAHNDPVGIGHVASLSRPGGNITGLSMLQTELVAKELELLKSILPKVTKIGVVWNPTTPSHPPAVKSVEAAAQKLAVKIRLLPARTVEEFDEALAIMRREQVSAFLVISSPLSYSQRARLADIALKQRLPGMWGSRENVEAGGLISYGADLNDLFRRAAKYIDKILKGANPGDLPVEQASIYELAINLKTAKALEIKVPQSVLLQATKVIE